MYFIYKKNFFIIQKQAVERFECIKSLYISYANVILGNATKLPKTLEYLGFSFMNLDGTNFFLGLTSLKSLELWQCDMSNETLACIAKNCSQLEIALIFRKYCY